jgi:hypothetical protein
LGYINSKGFHTLYENYFGLFLPTQTLKLYYIFLFQKLNKMPRRRVARYSSDEEELVGSDNSMSDFIDDDDLTEDEATESSDGNGSDSQNIDVALEYTLVDEQLQDSGHPETASSLSSTSPASGFVVDEEQPGPSRVSNHDAIKILVGYGKISG